MEELDELLCDELLVESELVDELERLDTEDVEEELVLLVCELLLVEIDMLLELLLSVDDVDSDDSVDTLLLDRDVLLELLLVAEDVLLVESEDVLLLESVDSEDELREWLLLDELRLDDVIEWVLLDDSDPVEKLDDSELLLLVLTVALEELLTLDDRVDSDEADDIDWLLTLEIDDCGELVLELLLLDDTELDDAELVEDELRLDVLELLLLSVDVLDVDSELVDDVLSDDSDDAVTLDVLSEEVLSVDVLLDDSELAVEVDSSSTAMIRNSCCDGPSCCGPLTTIRSSSSLVGKSRIAGAFSTPPIVSRSSARQFMLSASVTVTVSSVFSSACVVRWSEYTPVPAGMAKILSSRLPRNVPPFPR